MRTLKFRIWDKVKKEFIPFAWVDIVEWQMQTCNPQSEYEFQQFTGLLDSEGKEIYEGDFISCYEQMSDGMSDFKRSVCLVIWDGCCWCYSLDKERGFKNPHQILRYAKNAKIIGNKMQNPELTKQ